jgi:hypothetical protein
MNDLSIDKRNTRRAMATPNLNASWMPLSMRCAASPGSYRTVKDRAEFLEKWMVRVSVRPDGTPQYRPRLTMGMDDLVLSERLDRCFLVSHPHNSHAP